MSQSIKTLDEIKPSADKLQELEKSYKYQEKLTPILDAVTDDFDQARINEIVLWKVNRYAEMDEETLGWINQIDRNSKEIDEPLTREILGKLLHKDCKGFRLPMVSTILRFRNPKIYQIIDQRAYRILYGKTYKHSIVPSKNADLYLAYLKKLRADCARHGIAFERADRDLYVLDKEENGGIKY